MFGHKKTIGHCSNIFKTPPYFLFAFYWPHETSWRRRFRSTWDWSLLNPFRNIFARLGSREPSLRWFLYPKERRHDYFLLRIKQPSSSNYDLVILFHGIRLFGIQDEVSFLRQDFRGGYLHSLGPVYSGFYYKLNMATPTGNEFDFNISQYEPQILFTVNAINSLFRVLNKQPWRYDHLIIDQFPNTPFQA